MDENTFLITVVVVVLVSIGDRLQPIVRDRPRWGSHNTLMCKLRRYELKFFNYFRMTMYTFDFLLRRVERDLAKQNISTRRSIRSVQTRLTLDVLVYGRKPELSERVHYDTCATGELFVFFFFLPYRLFWFAVTKPNIISDRFDALPHTVDSCFVRTLAYKMHCHCGVR
jgi:hypothetical protein